MSRTREALKNIKTEVELGFTDTQALAEAQRCLNCDVETVFSAPACIECDACVDICPLDCISFVPNAPEEELRRSLSAPALNLTPGDLCVRAGQDRAGSWPRTKTFACIAAFAPSAVRPGRGTCRSSLIEMAQAGHACQSTR